MRGKSRIRRICSLLLRVILGIVVLSAIPVLVLRFIPPPASGLMIERRVASWLDGTPYTSTYQWVSLDRIAPVMGVAVIAAEDQNFPRHHGFDWEAIQKAIVYNERNPRTKGASTLSQQTAKNLFLWSGRTWVRKGLEAYFTILLETFWNKRRILETYLNIAEFGDGIYGVQAASQHYFGKAAARLTPDEAALLAAVLPNPRRYKVNAPGPYVQERRQWILEQIDQLGGPSLLQTIH